MPLDTCCPRCNTKHRLDDGFAGRKIRCKRCKQPFAAPSRPKDCGTILVPVRPSVDLPDTSFPVRGVGRGLILGLCIAGALLVVSGTIWITVLLLPSAMDRQLTDLKTGDPIARQQALAGLLAADPVKADRARVTAALEPLLFDDSDRALKSDDLLRAYLRWADTHNAPALIRMVANPTLPAWDARKAGLVIDALAKMKDPRAIDVIAGLLPDPTLHDRAINALRIMGPKAEPAVLEYLFVKDADTRARAGQLLMEYGTKPETVTAEALGRLKSNLADVRLSAVAWLADNPPSDETSKVEVSGALVKLLDELSPKVGGAVLRALKFWATNDCLPQVLAYARRDQKAAFASPDLIDVLARFPDEAAAEAVALRLTNPALRGRAVRALLKLDKSAYKAIPPYLDDPDPGVRKEAQDLCRLLKIPGGRQIEQILADVADTDIARSQAALRSLAQLRPDEANRAKVSLALNAALLDPNVAIREAALSAVRVWGSQENTSTLLKMLGDFSKDGMGRNARLIEALGSLKDPRAAQQLAQGLTHARERGDVSKALKAMGPAAEDAVTPFLQSADQGARIAACRILGEIGTEKSFRTMQTAAQMYYLDAAFNQELSIASQTIASRK